MKVQEKKLINVSKIAKELSKHKTAVGFFSNATYPDGTSVAEVAIYNEYGDPTRGRLPRSFMRNAIAKNKKDWEKILSHYIAESFENGNTKKPFDIIGLKAQADIKTSIAEFETPALKLSTIKQKIAKGQTAKPLEATKVMLDSVSYEVVNK